MAQSIAYYALAGPFIIAGKMMEFLIWGIVSPTTSQRRPSGCALARYYQAEAERAQLARRYEAEHHQREQQVMQEKLDRYRHKGERQR